MTSSQQRALDELWETFGIDYSPGLLDLDQVFGRDAERVLEIGFGNGESLVAQACAAPGQDFIGVDVHRPGVGHCLMLSDAAQIENLRVVCHDAHEVLEHQIGASALQRINLYFPDPWPKRRHQKRRIVQEAFLALAASRLVPDGRLHISTDWGPYAGHIDDAVAASDHFRVTERRQHDGEAPLDRPATKFERRGLKKGHKIVDWILTRNK